MQIALKPCSAMHSLHACCNGSLEQNLLLQFALQATMSYNALL